MLKNQLITSRCSFFEKIRVAVRGSCLHFFFVFFLLQSLVSCTMFAPASRQGSEEVSLPQSFSIDQTLEDPAQRWWESFDDAQLNGFITEAFSGNQTLASYWARLEKSQAQARRTGADLWPNLSGDAGASYSRRRAEDSSGSSTTESENYSLGLVAGYEIDLWGRVRAARKSAYLSVEASLEDYQAAAITVAAEIAELWLSILSHKQQQQLLEQQLATNLTYLELVELRFRKALASALDVLQQKQLIERIKAQLPLVAMQERLLQNQLATLLGRMPGELPEIAGGKLPELETVPAAGLPAQLLENRPDIAAAMKRLEAADQDLAEARADRLPSLNLTGSGAYDSNELDRLFDNWILNLGAALAGPVIDGGRRRAEVAVNEAAVKDSLAGYRQVVLVAVREVEDALIREQKIRDHLGALENQLKAAQATLNEARSRYVNGLNDYLPVLTQLLSVQGLESDLIQRQAELLQARVSLYRAIGGAWVEDVYPSKEMN